MFVFKALRGVIKCRVRNLPKCNSIIVRPNGRHNALVAMGRSDIAQDITVHLVLVLFRVSSHVIRIDEVSRNFIDGERFSETLSCLLVLGDAENADFLVG